MKCPKCRYLSFEPELRCKHCGFDFSLAGDDLPAQVFDELEQQDPDVPMVDLQLRTADSDDRPAPALGMMRPRQEAAPAPRRPVPAVALADRMDRDEVPRAVAAAAPSLARPSVAPAPRQVPTPTTDLPLFMKGIVPADGTDSPLPEKEKEDAAMHVPAAPRPLVVRRRAPEAPRPASAVAGTGARAVATNRGDRDLLEFFRRVDTEAAPAAVPVKVPVAPRIAAPAAPSPIGVGEIDAPARLKAAGLDMGVLFVLNLTVLLLTLRQCDLSIAQIASVPILPLAGFLASLSFGYLMVFSVVSGQTIGKMVFHLRVVGDASRGEGDLPTTRQMSYRALLTVPSILLLGLGFLPGLVGEGRAVHDRLTHTRVVRE